MNNYLIVLLLVAIGSVSFASAQTEIVDWQELYDGLVEKDDRFTTEIESLNKNIVSLQDENDGLEGRMQYLENRLEYIESDYNYLHSISENYGDAVGNIEYDHELMGNKFEELENDLEMLEDDLTTTNTNLQEIIDYVDIPDPVVVPVVNITEFRTVVIFGTTYLVYIDYETIVPTDEVTTIIAEDEPTFVKYIDHSQVGKFTFYQSYSLPDSSSKIITLTGVMEGVYDMSNIEIKELSNAYLSGMTGSGEYVIIEPNE